MEAVREAADAAGTLLFVDECRATGGGVADAVIAGLYESGFSGTARSVRAVDTFIPLGPGANHVLVNEADIVNAASPQDPVMKRAVLVCPGRGSYTEAAMGTIPADHPNVQAAEEIRKGYDLPPLLELDPGGGGFGPPCTCGPANVSPLIYLISCLDAGSRRGPASIGRRHGQLDGVVHGPCRRRSALVRGWLPPRSRRWLCCRRARPRKPAEVRCSTPWSARTGCRTARYQARVGSRARIVGPSCGVVHSIGRDGGPRRHGGGRRTSAVDAGAGGGRAQQVPVPVGATRPRITPTCRLRSRCAPPSDSRTSTSALPAFR